MHDLVDAAMVELGNTRNPHTGIKNPLALITKVVGGEEVIVSPGESLESEEAHAEVRGQSTCGATHVNQGGGWGGGDLASWPWNQRRLVQR